MAYATRADLKTYLGIKDSDTFVAASATDILTLTAVDINWVTGDEVFVSSTVTLPAGLAASTLYYVIVSSPLALQLATTEANADAGTAINITNSGTGVHTITRAVTWDDLLDDLLDRITARFERETGRVFTATTETRYFESDALGSDSYTLYMDRDLLTITAAGLTNGDDDATAIGSDEYWLVPRNGNPKWGIRLKADSDYSWEWDTDGWVSVAGTWGYMATPTADIVKATIEWAAYAFRAKDSEGAGDVIVFPESGMIAIPKGIPADVQRVIDGYRRII